MSKALLHELGKSLSYGRLTLRAKVLWPMLLASSDDQGRGLAEYDAIKWYICPNVPEIEIDDIAPLLGEMEQQKMIVVYGTDRGLVYQVIRWWEYQDLQWARPSKYEAPDGWTDRIRYSNRGDYFTQDWDTTGGFCAELKDKPKEEPEPEEPPVEQPPSEPPRILPGEPTQPNLTQPNLTDKKLAPVGEKLPPESIDPVSLFGEPPQREQMPTKEERIASLRATAGADPLSGVLRAIETASDAPMSIPAEAGGADPWLKTADIFCALNGIRLSDMPPKVQKAWPRQMQKIGEQARASPSQVIAAIRAIPDSEYHFKAYSSPYARSFEQDLVMLVSQMAAGQDVRVKGNGHAAHSRGNGSGQYPDTPSAGADDIETIQRKLAAVLEGRCVGNLA